MNQIESKIWSLLLILIFSVSFMPAVFAQGKKPVCNIEGTITDVHGHPVPEAVVQILETDQVVTTDKKGFYCIRRLAAGTYHLSISCAEYMTQQIEKVTASPDQTAVVNILLLPHFRQDVVVTATRSERRLSEVPVRTELVDREEIEASGSRTLADAVEFTTGVRVENDCQNCNFSQVRLLGLDGAYSQILVDSQPILSSMAAVYGIEHIPARMIDRIEIVKGGGSALYGPGSVAGVVNIIPREPLASGGTAHVGYQSVDGEPARNMDAVIDFVTLDRDISVSILGQVDKREAVDRTGDGFSDVGRRDLEAFGMRFGKFALDGAARLTIDYNRMYEDRRGGDNLDLPEFMAQVAESIQSQRDVGSVSWMHAVNGAFDYKLTASYAYTERDTYYGAGMDPNAYGNSKNPLTVLDSIFNNKMGMHTLSWGLQYTSDTIEDEQPAYDRFLDETYSDLGVFVQDDWRIREKWEMVYGVRFDKHSEIDSMIASPRLALKWSPASQITSRFSVATGFRAPQVFDEDLHITQVGGEGQIIRNDPDLNEERSTSYTLGMEWTPAFGPGMGLVEANIFYTGISDLFFVEETDDPATDELEFTRINLGEAKVYGLELNLGYTMGEHLDAAIGYVDQVSRSDEPDPDFGSRDFFRTPDRYGVFRLSWRDPRFVDVFFGAKYTGKMIVPHYAGYIEEDRLDTSNTFLTLDASVSKSVPFGNGKDTALVFTLGMKNITDEYQEDLDHGPDRDAGYVYGPRFPRSVYANIRFEF